MSGTDRETIEGLTSKEAEELLARHGPNRFGSRPKISPWKIAASQFQDLMVLILILAGLIASIAWWLEGAEGLPADAITIGLIVVANAILGFVQEYRAERTVEALQDSTEVKARVLRDGKVIQVGHEQLVPGDVVLLSEGDRVPADMELLRASALHVDESVLTGESVPVHKEPGRPDPELPLAERIHSLFAGTVVTNGEATGRVTTTGDETQVGQIADSLVQTVSEVTPLQTRLAHLGTQIGWGVLAMALLIGATVWIAEGKSDSSTLWRIAMFAVALAVAAVPEGLPAVLTVSLSAGARRLARAGAAARRLAAVETLGSVTTIVTDKTGTLTHNQMTAIAVLLDQEEFSVSGRGYDPEGEIEGSDGAALKQLVRAGVMAGRAELEDTSKGRGAVGDPMDAALLVLAEKAGIDWRQQRRQAELVGEGSFSSARARVSYLWKEEQETSLYVKGALAKVLPRCHQQLRQDGSLGPVDQEGLAGAEVRFGDQGWRTLALAVRRDAPDGKAEELEEELVLLGLVAFYDPPRAAVKEAIASCRSAGIKVVMMTGDHPRTAAAIGAEIGFTEPRVMTGSELQDSENLDPGDYNIFARVTPKQKLSLVESLVERGEVVAMTGDGVNDAPALKKVHVGVAMGGSGTAVAVEASDLVLLDDDFGTVVKAVGLGRSIFGNVQRFIAFLFSGNLGVVISMFVATVLAGVFAIKLDDSLLLPLTAAQILWMNLVTDGAPAVAFAMGESREDTMHSPPRNPRSPLLERSHWALLIGTGVCLSFIFCLVLDSLYVGGIFTLEKLNHVQARTAAFYTLVTARLMNALNFLEPHQSLFKSLTRGQLPVPLACLVSWLMTVALMAWKPSADFFGLEAIPVGLAAGLTVALCPLVLLVGELVKRFGPTDDAGH